MQPANDIHSYKIDCEKCFGLCCVSLYFSKSDGFPFNKESGKPCLNLENDFKCSIHSSLYKKNLKGCTNFDCFGAGQKVCQVTYKGVDWRNDSISSKEMFDVFVIMRQIHEMLWYLNQAYLVSNDTNILDMIKITNEISLLKPKSILTFDLDSHRKEVNKLLLKVSDNYRSRFLNKNLSKGKRKFKNDFDFIGKDLRSFDLKGANFRGSLLIAANLSGSNLDGTDLIGADFRDANIKGADFSKSLYITQFQVNCAKGDITTKLPSYITRPSHWEK